MKKLFTFLTIILILIFSFKINLYCSEDYLLIINGEKYTPKDFEIWWKYWKDKNMKFPNTLDNFTNWILLSNEAKTLGLDEEPSYKKKIAVFLQVRSLLQLRYDEVEKKININPDSLWKYYQKEYAPFYSVKIIVTDNKTEANIWKTKLKDKKKFDELFQKLKKTGKAKDLGWQRPVNIPEVFKEVVFKATKNKIYGPITYKNNYYFLVIEDIFAGSKKDFQKIHKNIAYIYKKYMEQKLTNDLIDKLKKKYHIEVNWNLIDKIKPFDNMSKQMGKINILQIGEKNLTAKEFKEDLEKEIKTRRLEKKLTDESLMKKNIINTIISQTLTSMEGLNRHYEKTVMKDIFWFYKRNRLIKEFEDKIIKPQIKITPDEIKNYYKTHIKEFTTPEMVKIAVIQTQDKKLIKQAFDRIKKGEDFFEVAKDIQFHGARPEYRRVNNLVKEVREAIKNLKSGDISGIIQYKNWFFIVKLIKKQSQKPHEFNKVKNYIKDILFNEKFSKLEQKYLEELRKKSEIKINKKVWEQLRKKYNKT